MYKGKFEESEENFLILSSISDKGDGKSFNPMLGGGGRGGGTNNSKPILANNKKSSETRKPNRFLTQIPKGTRAKF